MFKENLKVIISTFSEYIGTGIYILLFFISLIYIFFKEDNKKLRSFFLYYSVFTLLVVLNPIFNKIVRPIFTDIVYWRVYWILPLGVTIAYSAVKVVNTQKEKIRKFIITISILVILIIGGKCIFTIENYNKVNNYYKFIDERIEITKIIGKKEEEYKKVILPEELLASIRQIDARINLAYRRDPEGYGNNEVIKYLDGGYVEWITTYADKNDCNYVVYRKTTVLQDKMENFGFNKIGETENYLIYYKN